jgi:BirA family biotin operon repressor/biotin-[acetyl-CoA-carboxylase] ligase
MVNKKKLGGILSEMSVKGEQVDFVVVGVGINVSAEPSDFSPETAATATSLKQIEEKAWDKGEILENLVSALLQEVQGLADQGPAALIARWEQESGMLGERVRAGSEGRSVEGKVLGLAGDGQLKIQSDSGETLQLLAGDTTLL